MNELKKISSETIQTYKSKNRGLAYDKNFREI